MFIWETHHVVVVESHVRLELRRVLILGVGREPKKRKMNKIVAFFWQIRKGIDIFVLTF